MELNWPNWLIDVDIVHLLSQLIYEEKSNINKKLRN